MLMTAAGTIRPATVLVLGAGVAGLQAIATARRLGAVVQGFDVRAAVKEQVESLGAKFLEFDLGGDLEGDGRLRQGADARAAGPPAGADGRGDRQGRRGDHDRRACPGRRAPILVTEEAVKLMKPGSVIVDLAAETGGNCELSEPGETVMRHDVKILGAAERALDDGRARLAAVRAQHPVAAGADDRRGRAEARLRRRGDRRGVHHPGRGDRQRRRQGRGRRRHR